jgi:hypothetical protein
VGPSDEEPGGEVPLVRQELPIGFPAPQEGGRVVTLDDVLPEQWLFVFLACVLTFVFAWVVVVGY